MELSKAISGVAKMEFQPIPTAPNRRQIVLRALPFLMIVLAVFAVLLSPMTAAPASASFSIDTEGLMDQASTMFNSLWPVFGIIVGISVGVALAILIASKFVQAFKAAK